MINHLIEHLFISNDIIITLQTSHCFITVAKSYNIWYIHTIYQFQFVLHSAPLSRISWSIIWSSIRSLDNKAWLIVESSYDAIRDSCLCPVHSISSNLRAVISYVSLPVQGHVVTPLNMILSFSPTLVVAGNLPSAMEWSMDIIVTVLIHDSPR